MKKLNLYEICQLERLLVEALGRFEISDEYISIFKKIQKKLNFLKKEL